MRLMLNDDHRALLKNLFGVPQVDAEPTIDIYSSRAGHDDPTQCLDPRDVTFKVFYVDRSMNMTDDTLVLQDDVWALLYWLAVGAENDLALPTSKRLRGVLGRRADDPPSVALHAEEIVVHARRRSIQARAGRAAKADTLDFDSVVSARMCTMAILSKRLTSR